MSRPAAIVAVVGALLVVLFTVFNPLAGLGFALLCLLAAFPVMVYRWARHSLKVKQVTEFTVPGGILKVPGTISSEEMARFVAEFQNSRRGATVIVNEGVTFTPRAGGVPASGAPASRVWAAALEDYRLELTRGINEFCKLMRRLHDIELDRLGYYNDVRTDEKLAAERELGDLPPEVRKLGRMAWTDVRHLQGSRIWRELPHVIAKLLPDALPDAYVPVLDREFEAATDCRAGHFDVHLFEVRGEFAVRQCRTCSPSTFWIERL